MGQIFQTLVTGVIHKEGVQGVPGVCRLCSILSLMSIYE